MKHLLWLFILIPLVCYGADSKITDLPDVGASSDDVMYVVDNPGLSTASDNKITLGNLLLWLASEDWTVTGTWDWSGATITWPATITTTTFVGALTGNADTATALADNPTDCSANQFATTIAANGNLTCAALTDADVPADLTISGGTVNNSIIGGSVAAAGSFTTLGASGLVTANAGIDVKNGATDVGFIKIYEDSDDGTNYVQLKSQAMAASYDVVLPDAVPTGIVRADAGVVTASNTLSTVTINGGTASTVAVWDGSQNLGSLTSQNMVTTGQIDGRMKVVVATDTVTIDASASNQAVYYINGANSARTFNLPAAVAGLAYCFANALYAQALTVDPAAGDQIILAGVAADAGEYVESTSAAATDKICVLAIDTTYWLVTASTGTWAQDTP